MSENQSVAILIAGGGAAGLMAAVTAAETLQKSGNRGRVVLVERGGRVGRKLLATGNGRCNLTNRDTCAESYHGAAPGFIQAVLGAYPPGRVLGMFEKMGLLCVHETQGRMYPACGQASAVLDVLRLRCKSLGVEELCGFEIQDIRKNKNGFTVRSKEGNALYAQRVIIAMGGRAAPSFGADGGGFSLLSALGHRIIEPFPALVAVKSDANLCRALKGVRAKAEVTLLQGGKILGRESGEVQFADYGLSGIAVMQLSRYARGGKEKGLELSLNLIGEKAPVKDMLIRRRLLNGEEPACMALTGIVHKKLSQEMVRRVTGTAGGKIQDLSDRQIDELARLCRDLRFPVTGVTGWQNAQVTAGGADAAQFDAETMQSKKVPGLYAAGEVLDVDGPCGGYNLQWAWSSGALAGRSAAQSLITGRK
ncbi:MAG: aminoacetone oxidase family FAD-binding enzyme [Clostridiales bacterium]|nr:aminoacetone oxidase family FAD-binding enzyme [Clostridiales bacterium]